MATAARAWRPTIGARWEVPVSGVIIAFAAALWLRDVFAMTSRWGEVSPQLANDYHIYMNAASRWLAGGGFYTPEQLVGPYLALPPVVLYPPTALLLFVPFTFLPWVLWWAIPLGITAWIVVGHRPRPLAWAGIALCLWYPTTTAMVFWGNPGMWIVAALALATRYGWPGALVLVKPSLAPFALVGVWRRSWWITLGLLALVSLAFGPMWFDYLTALRNLTDGGSSALYSISQIPPMAIPLFAWLGRR